jgi:hypothetical protein
VIRFNGAVRSSMPVMNAANSPTERRAAADCTVAIQMITASAIAAMSCTIGVLVAAAAICFIT